MKFQYSWNHKPSGLKRNPALEGLSFLFEIRKRCVHLGTCKTVFWFDRKTKKMVESKKNPKNNLQHKCRCVHHACRWPSVLVGGFRWIFCFFAVFFCFVGACVGGHRRRRWISLDFFVFRCVFLFRRLPVGGHGCRRWPSAPSVDFVGFFVFSLFFLFRRCLLGHRCRRWPWVPLVDFGRFLFFGVFFCFVGARRCHVLALVGFCFFFGRRWPSVPVGILSWFFGVFELASMHAMHIFVLSSDSAYPSFLMVWGL